MILTKPCERCNALITINENQPFERVRRYCGPCSDVILDIERFAEESKARLKRDKAFRETIPPLYRETDREHAGIRPVFRDAAEQWDFDGPRGLGLIGASGGGKTRLLFGCLMRAHERGRTCDWISHNTFSKLVISAFSDGDPEARRAANERLERLARVDVLLIDDLGKAPSSERCDAELEELIETRGTWSRPTLWSANGGGAWLVGRFSADRGEPLVRRLAEFSTVVKG